MSRVLRSCRIVVLATAACALLAGCGSKVNKSNFDRIKVGMTQTEVEDILGKGEIKNSTSISMPGANMSGKQETWKDGDKTIMVTYMNDKVSAPPIATGL